MSAALEIVTVPLADMTELSSTVDSLAALARESAELAKREAKLKARIKEAMIAAGIDSFLSSGGHRASLYEVSNTKADRALAERLLSPALIGRIWKVSKSIVLRVK